jgi:amino acid adenylation domain-containing protein
MPASRALSFWIIGETTLSIRCAELILERGHEVRGLVTELSEAVAWAAARGVEALPFDAARPRVMSAPFDILLSAVNSRILGAEWLAAPRIGAVNFHDAPLPRYAGSHATCWAILNGEREHGITWHWMVDLVDAGPIVRQRAVPVEPDDTSLTLNARCYEAAIAAFGELLRDGEAGALPRIEQDLSRRTYYARDARPPTIIDWSRPASEISALVRALDFGPAYPNPIGRSKVLVGSHHYICGAVSLGAAADEVPGTLVGLADDALTIAAADRLVSISGLAELDGAPVSARAIAEREGIGAGDPLAAPDAGARDAATQVARELSPHERYWRRAMARARPHELPRSAAGGHAARGADAADLSGLAALTRDRVPGDLACAAVAALSTYLARITGESSVTIGYEHPAARFADPLLTGLFAARVPITVEVDRARPFSGHLTDIRNRLAEVARRRTFARDLLARMPGLQPGARGLPNVLVRVAPEDDALPAGTELALDVAPEGRITVRTSSPALLGGAARIGEQLAELVGAAAADGSIPLGRLSIVPQQERFRLLQEWNDTRAAYPDTATIHSLFEARARAAPDHPAVLANGTTHTFGAIDALADRGAAVLRAHGVAPGDIVGLRMRRTAELVAGVFAILKAGAAYLPLDPSLPAERLRYLLEDSKARLVLTSRGEAGAVPGNVRCLHLDDPVPGGGTGAGAAADATSPAYVIYTSGSTGLPKGVVVHHRGAVNYISWAIDCYRADQGSGAPVHSPLTFDLTVTSLLVPLLAGRPVHLVDEQLGAEGLAAAIRNARDLTLAKLTPSHLELLHHQLAPESLAGRVRALVIGGENLTGAQIDFWQRHAPGTRLINEYGPTETVVGCCTYEVPPGRRFDGSVPIGRPIANTRLYVLDAERELVPIGVPGELYIGGDGVSLGYLDRAALTAERFVPDPFDPRGGRLYRSGDLVRYAEDGNLEFLGRLDDQVKLRGYRIELGEIEATLAAHPAVAGATVRLWATDATGPRLAAYIVPAGADAPAGESLRDWCAARLPEYMIPGSFDVIPVLPLTAHGKVDRERLPAPTGVQRADGIAPRSPLEAELARIWSELLGVPAGVTDNFFELGGHSLLAVRMIERVREATGSAPPLSVLLTRPTIEHIASAIAAGGGSEEIPPILAIREGAGPAFFYFHGEFGGRGFYVETIGRQLGPGQGFYVIRPSGPGESGTIERMAEDAVARIKSVQPTGPYMLGGLCNGAAVAVEVARRLRAAGDQVPLLTLVNSSHRNSNLAFAERFAAVAGRLLRFPPERVRALHLRTRESLLRTLVATPISARPDSTGWRAALVARTTLRVCRRLVRRGRGSAPEPERRAMDTDVLGTGIVNPHPLPDWPARYQLIDRATSSYVARPLDLSAVLVHWGTGTYNAEPELHEGDATLGWRDVFRSTELHIIPPLADGGRDLPALGRLLADLVRAARSGSAEPGA